MKFKFKKGDIVRCVNKGCNNLLHINKIYTILSVSKSNYHPDEEDFIRLTNYNFPYKYDTGFFSSRFKKVSSEDMFNKERSLYINYKLGVKMSGK